MHVDVDDRRVPWAAGGEEGNDVVFNEDEFYSSSKITSSIAPMFRPTMLRNLHRACVLDSLAPVTSVLVGELVGNEVSPQVYVLWRRGPTSTLRVLRHGLSVTELAISELPGVPGAVFNVRDDVGEGSTGGGPMIGTLLSRLRTRSSYLWGRPWRRWGRSRDS